MSQAEPQLMEKVEAEPEKVITNLGIKMFECPRLVILGGGFSGLHLLKNLGESNFQIVLIDKCDYHTLQPLLYQVATSSLGTGADSATYPRRNSSIQQPDYHFRKAEAVHIDTEQNVIATSEGKLRYDYLVIATGAQTDYSGIEGIEEHALPVKNIEETLKIRIEILKNFEEAMFTRDLWELQKLTNIVIAGGGTAGVKLAGSIAEFKRYVMTSDYPGLDINKSKIYLIEHLPESSGNGAEKPFVASSEEEYLQELGVVVKKDTRIISYDGDSVEIDEENIPAKVVLWTGGVSGAFPAGLSEKLITRDRRIKTDAQGRVLGYENIFALGDVASIETTEDIHLCSQMAVQQGNFIAQNLILMCEGKDLKSFKFNSKETTGTIGDKRLAAELQYEFKKPTARLKVVGIHRYSLASLKSKLTAFTDKIRNFFSQYRET